jgi:hypothetical protein
MNHILMDQYIGAFLKNWQDAKKQLDESATPTGVQARSFQQLPLEMVYEAKPAE